MRPQTDWLPVRWPCGPLEVVLRKAEKNQPLLADWLKPETLELVRGTPFNCILVPWAAGIREDAEQQRALAPLIAGARARGITVVGWVADTVEEAAADAQARAAGCAGVVRSTVKGVWPGVETGHSEGEATSGPTGAPWIDSNGWITRLAAARQPGEPVWLWFDPPKDRVLRPESYLVALADAEAFGGRWVVSLADSLRVGVVQGNADALSTWKRLAAAASFFERHRDWRAYTPQAALGVVSDFAGDNETLATEVLNLSTRRGLHYRILLKDRALGLGFQGLQAVLYADAAPPPPALAAALLEFTRGGGTLILGKTAAAFVPKGPSVPLTNRRYDVSELGRGRVAVSHRPGDFEDPFLVACDAQLLLSYRNDIIRFWNYGTLTWHLTTAPQGKRGLLHVVNFSGRPGGADMGLIVRDAYKSARLVRLEDNAPLPLKPEPARVGIELPLPPIPVYAAVELEG